MQDQIAFQDESFCKNNHCWICGNDNSNGLYIKSRWDGDESICEWEPKEFHTAGWPSVLNGGIISGIMDCHCLCTVIAEYYRDSTPKERASPQYWFATGSLKVDFLRPTPIDKPVQLRAKIVEMHEKKAMVTCSLFSEKLECARGKVLAVRVPAAAGPMK